MRRATTILATCLVSLAAASATAGTASAAERMRFWNTTSVEIDDLRLSPAGADKWGPNQCLNDDDKSVEADERLALKDVHPGRYDVRLKDVHGRTCTVRNVEVKTGGKYAFSIDDKELTDCSR